MQSESTRELRNRYREIAQAARELTMEEWVADGYAPVRLADIGHAALAQAETWTNRRKNWDWSQLHRKWSRRPRHFALAIWVDPKLCGLGLGRVTDGKVYARLDRLERAPTATYDEIEKVAELAIAFLENVARVAECGEVVLWEPDPALIQYYKEFGYDKEILKHGKIRGLKRKLPDSEG